MHLVQVQRPVANRHVSRSTLGCFVVLGFHALFAASGRKARGRLYCNKADWQAQQAPWWWRKPKKLRVSEDSQSTTTRWAHIKKHWVGESEYNVWCRCCDAWLSGMLLSPELLFGLRWSLGQLWLQVCSLRSDLVSIRFGKRSLRNSLGLPQLSL